MSMIIVLFVDLISKIFMHYALFELHDDIRFRRINFRLYLTKSKSLTKSK